LIEKQLGGAGPCPSLPMRLGRKTFGCVKIRRSSTPGFTSSKRSCAVRFEQEQFHPPIVARAKVEAGGRPSCAPLNG
jgi:hypothetical protein